MYMYICVCTTDVFRIIHTPETSRTFWPEKCCCQQLILLLLLLYCCFCFTKFWVLFRKFLYFLFLLLFNACDLHSNTLIHSAAAYLSNGKPSINAAWLRNRAHGHYFARQPFHGSLCCSCCCCCCFFHSNLLLGLHKRWLSWQALCVLPTRVGDCAQKTEKSVTESKTKQNVFKRH